jgi:hypothetical protein
MSETERNPERRIALFQRKEVRRAIHNNEWGFVIADVVAALTDSANPQGYFKYMRKRTRALCQAKDYSAEWIGKRMRSVTIRDELTDEWKKRGVKEQCECPILTAEISKAAFGLDANGNVVVEGIPKLSLGATNRVQGDWELQEVKPSKLKTFGPQTGSGELRGEIKQDRINLDLNPGRADNNVILSGQVTTPNIFGTWGYYRFAGELASGKFEAVKK